MGWNPALVLSPTSVIFVLLHTTNLEPHLNMKHFKTILMLSLYHYYTLQLPPQASLSSLVDPTCFKELVPQSSNTVFTFLSCPDNQRKPAQAANWKLKQLSGLLLPPLSVFSSFMVAGQSVPDKLGFLLLFSRLAALSHRYSNSRLMSGPAEPNTWISEDFCPAGMLLDRLFFFFFC